MAAQKLNQSMIVDAALAVADREGLERVSMRKVAAELGAAPMGLYRHVASKTALLDSMLARVVERSFAMPGNPAVAAREARRTLRAHPNWLPLFARRGAMAHRIPPELMCFIFGVVLVEQMMKGVETSWTFDEAFERGLRGFCADAQNLHAIGPIELFMVEDHVRIDALLAASERPDGGIDEVTYTRFRHDLLRHIGMEEKVLLPDARARRGGEPLEIAAQLRREHGEIAKLLVGSPTPERLAELRAALARHNPLEEGPNGLYALCDALAGAEGGAVVERLRAQPKVPLAAYYDGPAHTR